MKKIVVLILTFFLVACWLPVSAQGVWQNQYTTENSDLVSISFPDSRNGWIAAEDGTILSTQNSGTEWWQIAHIENFMPTKIFFRNRTHGWLAGGNNNAASVLRTTNGGTTWETVFTRNNCHINDIFFVNDTLGWIAGADVSDSYLLSFIRHSIDGGVTWETPFGALIENELYSIGFRNENLGQTCGQDGVFMSTANGGRGPLTGWGLNLGIPNYRKDLYSIYNAGPLYGCATGEDGFVLFTKDNWNNWQDAYSPSSDSLMAVTGLPDGTPRYWAAGKNGCITNIRFALFMLMITEEQRITSNDLNDICAVDDNHVWAVGDNSTIIYYSNNRPPVAVDDEVTVSQDSKINIFVLNNDSDPDNNDLRILSATQGKHGSVMIALSGNYLIYDPDDEYSGKDTVKYTVTDDEGGTDIANIYIEITEVESGPFEKITINDSIAFGNAIWGDIDKDKDYDILVCGEKSDGSKVTSLYINNGGVFEKAPASFEGLSPRNDNAMQFIDLNQDGFLDFIITGENNNNEAVTNLYIYEFGFEYVKYETGIPGVVDGSVDWGDYDNDGDMDLLISGKNILSNEICEIYNNDGKSDAPKSWKFTFANKNFHPLDESVARFVDLNKDDYLDVVAMGTDNLHQIKGYYYLNNEGLFTSGEITGHNNGSIDFCDFDSDGKMEILVTGDTSFSGPNPSSKLLKFDNGSFVEIGADLENVSLSSADWGDYDNDGDYDLLLCGMNNQLAYATIIYENRNNSLVNSGIRLPGMASGTVCWGDYDYDGDLDILLSGYVSSSPNRLTAIFKNNLEVQNQNPAKPGNLSFSQTGTDVQISWNPATDSETPSNGLTYNVSLKRKHLYKYLLRPPVEDDGTLKLTIPGNAFDNKILFRELDEGALYTCQVQTVDAGFHTSEWAEFDFNTASDYFQEQDFSTSPNTVLSAEWLDYDSDNDLDLFIAGNDPLFQRIYPVSNNEPDENYVQLGSLYFSDECRILDYNNDNVPDFSYGFADSAITISITGVGDTIIKTGFIHGSFDWGDYENDGDEDLIITGVQYDGTYMGKLFRNVNGNLENYSILIPGVVSGDIEWIDFDSDGDLDIALCGYNDNLKHITRIYENRNGAFIDTEMGLMGLIWSDMDFSDYDDDGDIDLLICGGSESNLARTIIYENVNNRYFPKPYFLTQIIQGSCKWADLNSDGYTDIVLSGINDNNITSDKKITKVFIWNEDDFIDAATLQGLTKPVIALGDYNGDMKLDMFITGESGQSNFGFLYKNVSQYNNFKPEPPENINILAHGDNVEVSWMKGRDNSLQPHELTYNIRVGTTPGGSQIVSPKSNNNGTRKVVDPGNAHNRTFSFINGLSPDSVYYLSIQSVDASFIGSKFSDEIAFNPRSGYFIPETIILSDKKITNASWVDYDSDKDLDLMVRSEIGVMSKPGIYQNNGGKIDTTLMEIETSSFTNELLTNDADNDNDVDVLLFPQSPDFQNTLLENENGLYTKKELDLTGLFNSNSAWRDFDNDGDEDLIIMGTDESSINMLTLLYKNNIGTFESYDNLLEAVISGKIKWVDIDNDGDKDIVRNGYTKNLQAQPEDVKFIISENMGGAFRSFYPDIPGLVLCDMDFGDFDNDGDMDLLFCGASLQDNEPHTYICSNVDGVFSISDSITPVCGGSCRWLDVDNDGLFDIIITGFSDNLSNYYSPDANRVTEIFRNSGNGFTKIASLETFIDPAVAIGDYDNDGLADIFIGGKQPDSKITGIIYKNHYNEKGPDHYPPNLYMAEVFQDSARIHWLFPNLKRKYYNLKIGTTPGGNDVLSSLSHDDGYRKVASPGNMQESETFTLKGLQPATTYYYSIQSINRQLIGSRWSQEMQFESLPTGIANKVASKNIVNVYPNPVKDILNIEIKLNKTELITLKLYTQTGQEILSEQLKGIPGINKTSLLVPDVGAYLLKIILTDQIISKKIIRTD